MRAACTFGWLALGCAAGCDLSPSLVVGEPPRTSDSARERDEAPVDSPSPSEVPVQATPERPAAEQPDLHPFYASALPEVLAPSDPIVLSVDLENLGRAQSDPALVRAELRAAHGLASLDPSSIEIAAGAAPTLAVGEIASVTLRGFIPARTEPGPYRVEVTVDPSDAQPESNENNNRLEAGGVDVSTLRLSSKALDFGTVAPGCKSSLDLEIENRSSMVSVLSNLQGAHSPFFLEAANFPMEIQGNETRFLHFEFRPTVEGSFESTAFLNHDQFVGPQRLSLRGEARRYPLRRDQFRQRLRPELDLIWVIQSGCTSSCSLLEEQTELVDVAWPLIRAVAGQVDGQLWVARANEPSRLAGPLSLHSSQATMMSHLIVGDQSPGPAQYFEAVHRALASGRIRDDVGVVVAFIGLQDDRSTVELHALLDHDDPWAASSFEFHGLLPSAAGCSPGAEATPSLDTAVARSGGVRSSICDLDDFAALRTWGDLPFGLRRMYRLNRALATLETLYVEVNGRLVEQFDEEGTVRWRFDEATSTVVFSPDFVPHPGALVTIGYHSRC